MTRTLFLLSLLLWATGLWAQKSPILARLETAPGLTSGFRALAGPVLAANDDDDCTPPPCSGIIDPWTCECYPDIKDPWENEVMAKQMRQVQQLEAAMSRGEGKTLLPASLVSQAKKRHPGETPRALYRRAHLYAQALRQ